MPKTKAELRDRVANDLGILRLNQSLDAQDQTRIEDAYDEVYAELKTEGIAAWPKAGSVPDEFVPYMVALVADNCLATYKTSPEIFQRIKDRSVTALREIRKFRNFQYISATEPEDF